MRVVQHAARGRGELHHRRKRMNLRGAHEQLLVDRDARPETAEKSAVDQVGADEKMPLKPRRLHFRNQPPERIPVTGLVVEPLREGTPPVLPAGAELVERILRAERRVRRTLVHRHASLGQPHVGTGIEMHVRRVELESVDPELAHERVKPFAEPLHRNRRREIENRGLSVPPLHGGGRPVRPGAERTLPRYAAVLARVHRHERTHPERHLEAHGVKLVHHRLRVVERRRVKLPHAISGLPRVIDHDHAGRQPGPHEPLGVLEHAFLVLVVVQLDPRVVLRRGEEHLLGNLAHWREMCLHHREVRGAKRTAVRRTRGDGGLP